MNIFKKHQKAILSALMAISALSTMAIPAFAEGEATGSGGFDDPMLYLFIGFVAVFFTICVGAVVIYLKIRRQRNMREWKMDDGTTKLYEDLDDAKWDAPDTVFLDALEPTAALLLDAQPVEKVYGLDGIIITEGNPNPIQAINSGADPYAYKIGLPETNTVYEDVLTTPLEDEPFVNPDTAEPINTAYTPKVQPLGMITTKTEYNNVAHGYVPGNIHIYEDNVERSTLVDEPVAPKPITREEPILPKAEPLAAYVTKDVPITIVTSNEVGGVVHISASIYENKFAPTVLVDEEKTPAPAGPIMAAVTPKLDPLAFNVAREETPVHVPAVHATIVEDVATSAMVDEVKAPVATPVIIPEATTPMVDALSVRMVRDEEPVVAPATEANVFEAVETAVLVDEPAAPAPVEPVAAVIDEALTPSQEFLFDSETPDAPVVVETAAAMVYEQTETTVLVDEPVAPAPVESVATVINEATTPMVDALSVRIVRDEEPIETVDAIGMVYEQTETTVLVDEPVAPAPVEPVVAVIDEALTPSQEFLFDSETPDAPVVVETAAGMVYEQTEATVLVDEPVAPAPVEPVATVINEATTPMVDALSVRIVRDEEPIETVNAIGMVYEQTEATVLVDEPVAPAPVEPVATVVSINEAINPSQEFLFDAEIAEEPTKTVDVAGMVYETTAATVLEDEIVAPAPVEPVATVINEATTPMVDALSVRIVRDEEPTKTVDVAGMVYETTATTVLEDEIVAPAPVEPVATVVSINEAINPSQEFLFDAEIAEEPTKTVDVAGMVYETTAATLLEDEIVAPAPVEPVATVVSISEAINPSQEFLFDAEIAEEPVKTVDVAGMVYETTSATLLEDEIKAVDTTEPVATIVSINEAINPSQEFLFDAEIAEEPTKTVDVAGMVYETTAATLLEDEIVAPAPVEPVATVVSINEAINPSQEFLFDREIAEEPTKTVDVAGMVYETTSATVLEDEIKAVDTTEPVATIVSINEAINPSQEFLFDREITEEPTKTVDVAGMVYETTSTTVLEDDVTIPVAEATLLVAEEHKDSVIPTQEFLFDKEIPETAIITPTIAGMVYENTDVTVLEDEIIPTVEITSAAPEQVVIDEAKAPKASPINHTVFTEEKIVRTTKGADVYEKTQSAELVDEHISGYNTKTEEIYEEPTTRNVFDVVDEEEAKTEISEEKIDNTPNEDAREEVVTKTEAIISTDDGVIEVTEETTSETEAPKADVVPKRASKISTIPMTKDGRVKHEEPMIPTLPHISARGVGPDKNAPFVLPATATGMGMMEKNPAYNEEKSEPSFENALNKANDLPIAPIANREVEEPKYTKAEPKKSDVVVASSNVSINYDGEDTEVPAIPEELPELIEEPVEELIENPVEEPIEETPAEPEIVEPEVVEPEVTEPEVSAEPEIPDEPVATTVVEEPVIEEPIVEEEPEVAPVFTNAEKADELMTDAEAEEHIEIIEETPGRERKGKFHAINLDTICDHFEDGEKVTLDDLKAKKLAPQSCGRLKVLARGTMNKKLTIEADSFSLQAVKMITLAGGHSEQYR